MSNIITEFASQRFAPRQATDRASYSAVEHYKPESEWHGWPAVRFIVCMAACVAIGAMLAGWGAP